MHLPTKILFHQQSQQLEIGFEDATFKLSAEYLRQFSPSAEQRGHGKKTIQFLPGKAKVKILRIEPIGQYAIKLHFDDKHDSGIYSWDFLHELGTSFEKNWQDYCEQLSERNLSRESTSFHSA